MVEKVTLTRFLFARKEKKTTTTESSVVVTPVSECVQAEVLRCLQSTDGFSPQRRAGLHTQEVKSSVSVSVLVLVDK